MNEYKGKNFTNYINDLRIEYFIKEYKKNPKYSKYTIKFLGEEMGFNNAQSFSKAFLKKTGIKLSVFIKNTQN